MILRHEDLFSQQKFFAVAVVASDGGGSFLARPVVPLFGELLQGVLDTEFHSQRSAHPYKLPKGRHELRSNRSLIFLLFD